jgi:alpha-galactosidase
MLEIGNGAMTNDEYKTHMSLWAILAAPLLAGNDLRSMTPEILAILTNKEVIAVDQDKLGKQGQRVWQAGEQEIWTRQLSGGAIAVALFNRANSEAKVTLRPADLKLNGLRKARDLWSHQAVTWPSDGEYSVVIPSHGVMMLKLSK